MTPNTQDTNSHGTGDVQSVVKGLLEKAKTAQSIYENYTQRQVDEVVTAVGWALVNPDNNHLCLPAFPSTALTFSEIRVDMSPKYIHSTFYAHQRYANLK